jgi:hypothetical protein
MMLYSEFRDGNVPAGHEQLRVLKTSLAHLPASMAKVSLRSDTAGYQEELLLYCGEGKDSRFGVIDFAIGADVTEAFRAAVLATAETEWKPLVRMFDGKPQGTDQEWAEVCYVPNWAGYSRKRADYRFLAIREPLRQLPLGDTAELPFPTQAFAGKGTCKLFGVVTNLRTAGDQVIWWLRAERQERGGPFGTEDRPGRRTTAIGAVRRQRRMVGFGEPGPQSERRDEAAGAWQGLGDKAHEGDALPSDRFARTRGQPCPAAFDTPWRGGRGAGDHDHGPSDHPGTGLRTIRLAAGAPAHSPGGPRFRPPFRAAKLPCARAASPRLASVSKRPGQTRIPRKPTRHEGVGPHDGGQNHPGARPVTPGAVSIRSSLGIVAIPTT